MLRVTYTRVADLVRDLDGQLAHGGLFVQVEPPPGLTLQSEIPLLIVAPDGTEVQGTGQVLHVHAGKGLAVSFPPGPIAALRARVEAGMRDAAATAPPRHERLPEEAPEAPEAEGAPPAEPSEGSRRPAERTTAEKIQLALHGSRDERAAILRDRNRALHGYVLKNPQLGADEVLEIAKGAGASPELLGQLAARREWIGQPQVAAALARNPRTPPATAVRALDFVSALDLRQLAKGGAPRHVVDAARKKILRP